MGVGEFLLDVSAIRLPCGLRECHLKENRNAPPPTPRVTLGDKLPTLRLVARQKGSRCHLLTADLGRSCQRGGASPEQLCLSVTEQQTGRQQMGTDGTLHKQ